MVYRKSLVVLGQVSTGLEPRIWKGSGWWGGGEEARRDNCSKRPTTRAPWPKFGELKGGRVMGRISIYVLKKRRQGLLINNGRTE